MTRLRRTFLAVVLSTLACCVLGGLSPAAARADGDPGSDVLVYQNLFVASDANISIADQVQLGGLLTAAQRSGFTIRVAIIARPDDLGAITPLWEKPASYASFLGIELSLAYSQRLLVVMPAGFGFNWQGHSTAAAYRALGAIAVRPGGSGLAASAETAVRALASASGVWLAAPSGAKATGGTVVGGTAIGGTAVGGTAGTPAAGTDAGGRTSQSGGHPAATGPSSGIPVALIAGAAIGVLAACVLGGWLARRTVLAIPGSWLAAGFVGVATALIVLHTVLQPTAGEAQAGGVQAGTAQAGAGPNAALQSNPDLDPGTSLSEIAPNFTLTDQFGQPVALRSYRGKVVILAFNDSECTTVCPLTTAALVDAKAMLGSAASQVQLLGIDANPKATAIDDVLSYSQLHGMLYQWRYLTGSLPQLESVWKDYSIGVTLNQNQVDHEPAIFVINQQGRLVRLYLTQLAYSAVPQLGQLLATEVSSLLPGHPAVRSHLSYQRAAAISPAYPTSLPESGGGYLTLGPGQPGQQNQARLYLFFATWDQEITSLGGQLEALNAYQSAAAAARLPELTAIDEGSVEPSASALPSFLASLTHPLSYPIGIDDSGQVADGYGVQGEPWLMLASASGEVIWSWEVSTSGWLTTARLDRHLRAALASAAKAAR